MSLSARDRHALDSIEVELASSDPQLASMLAGFTHLAAGQRMPEPETIRRLSALRSTLRRRRTGSKLGRLGWQHACLALWLLMAIALIALGAVAGRGGHVLCKDPVAGCARHVRAHSASLLPGYAMPGSAGPLARSWP